MGGGGGLDPIYLNLNFLKHSNVIDDLGKLGGVMMFITALVKYSEYEGRDQDEEDVL